MPAIKKKSGINLIPQDKFAASTFGRILSWLLSTFRVIVIFVEMIVMVAFLSRFWLDAKNSDLNDELKQRQALIVASKNFEDEFNSIKGKLSIFSSLGTSVGSSGILTKIPSILPEEIYLKNISITEADITINGESPSEQSIAQFIANLEAINQYKDTNLTQVGSNQESGMITFKIAITK